MGDVIVFRGIGTALLRVGVEMATGAVTLVGGDLTTVANAGSRGGGFFCKIRGGGEAGT